MKVGFDGGIKLEFHGAKLSSNGGLLAYRDLDHALGLFGLQVVGWHTIWGIFLGAWFFKRK